MSLDRMQSRSFDVLIIGAGPAGLAATACFADEGRVVGLVDDNPDLGGQIWRGERPKPSSSEAAAMFAQVREAKFEQIPATRIVGLAGPNTLLAESQGRLLELKYQSLILATGARELFLPFPGWTLPNVMGAGGLQALVKSGLPIAGKSVVVAGSGPLLLAVAALLKKKGAVIQGIYEQAPMSRLARFGLGLWSEPGKLLQAIGLRQEIGGVRYRGGCWPIEAVGDDVLRSVTLNDGRATWSVECDYLACGFGLVPNLELPGLLGCSLKTRGTVVDEWQRTTVPKVFCVGEATGIGGLDLALLEGRIAGLTVAHRSEEASKLFKARDKARKFADALERSFALRDELRHLARLDTIVCRCEDVPASALQGRTSWVDAKLQTRCGMGPCQGRICGAATRFLHGWEQGSVRPPIFPVGVSNLGGVASEYQISTQIK
jgi:NADPH-dependent 2,4-dienoyl-CoA reductase/sulfur reductase-like enzyme